VCLHGIFERLAVDYIIRNIHTRLHRILQHGLTVCLEKRQHQPTKKPAQNTAETVSALNSATGEHGYLATILSRIILFVQAPTGVAAIHPAFHSDVWKINGVRRLRAAPYMARNE